MSKKAVEMILCFFLVYDVCFAMASEREDFTRAVCNNPRGDLRSSVSGLTGEAKKLGDAFIKLYVQREKDRSRIFSSFVGDDIKRLCAAADFVARSYYAKMRESSFFDVDRAEQAVDWLNLVNNDSLQYGCGASNVCKEGERISDLLQVARQEYDKRKALVEEDHQYEEDLKSLLTHSDGEDSE